MSKRRQTIAGCPVDNKKSKLEENCDSMEVSELSDKQLRQCLLALGETPGPVMPSTRHLYEKLLQKYRDGEKSPNSTIPTPSSKSPSRPKKVSIKPAAANNKLKSPVDTSPDRLSPTTPPVVIDSLPDPPKDTKRQTPKTKRTPLRQQQRTLSSTRLDQSTPLPPGTRNKPLNNTRPILSANAPPKNFVQAGFVFPRTISPVKEAGNPPFKREEELLDYPEDEDRYEEAMEVNPEPSMCVSYAKSPYKKTRRSICKAQFDNTDFVVFNGSEGAPNQTARYIDMGNNGIQALVTQDCSTVALLNAIKAAKGCLKIYAGVTINNIIDGKTAVSNAFECGVDAVVICFSKYECSDPAAIADSIKQVLEGNLTSSYFYYHNPNTKACPVRISKKLLEYKNGYQGIFISADTEQQLLQLELLGLKIHETDTTKVLRSLAHGIDSFASFEGIIAMPVIRKLKEEYYEGNTSESCRLQLILCRLVRALTKHGDLLPSLHTALKLLGQVPGALPSPLQPLKNDIQLMKELSDLNIDKWQNIAL